MTEITRVPIKPIAKGSLTKLWLGVILAVLVGAGLAWAAVPRGLDVDVLQAGTGPTPKAGEVIFIRYKGTLAANGTVFEDVQKGPFPVQGLFPDGQPLLYEEGQMIPGFYQGLKNAQKGGKYRIFIPADLAYGATPPPGAPIPPNSDLQFEVEVVDIQSRETVERNIQIIQQMMQQQQQQGGAPGGAPRAPAEGAPQAPAAGPQVQ